MLSLRIATDKVRDYLLSLDHPQGGPKAKFFIANGFTRENDMALSYALADHAVAGQPGTVKESGYGRRHVIKGPMLMPNGTHREVISVWQEAEDQSLSFITAYPG